MKSAWSPLPAAGPAGERGERGEPGELAERVYTSRLIGAEPQLVMHGGGNTSVKLQVTNVLGVVEDVLYVKGSGRDLKVIREADFAPLRIEHLRALAQLEQLGDLEMARQFQLASIEPGAPAASVESILHAVLPHRYVDHAHADAIVTLGNTPSGRDHLRSAYGDRVIIVPYVKPGFDLCRATARLVRDELSPTTEGIILMGHGVIAFGESAQESYERLIDLVTVAEDYLKGHNAWELPRSSSASSSSAGEPDALEVAELRHKVSAAAGTPLILRWHDDAGARDFANRADVAELSQRGPATPDHVLFTKRVPLLGRDVEGFAERYRAYFNEHEGRAVREPPLRMLDPAPRVVLDPDLGLCTAGQTVALAQAAGDLYLHTVQAILRAEALERWKPLTAAELFEVEYWELEQAKLWRKGSPLELAGEVALVTGAASGIGRAIAQLLLEKGAAVCGIDKSDQVVETGQGPAYLGVVCDLTEEAEVRHNLDQVVRSFGGIDILVLNAGVFPPSTRLESLSSADWRKIFAINLDSNMALMAMAHRYLRLAPRGGRVLAVGSKNVKAPGPGAGAYSASKAALTQLCRVAALEWGGDGIRVNVLHPNAVFDTGIWSEEVIAQRAKQYGVSPEEYRRRSVLGVEVTSRDVAELAVSMCGHTFSKVTGAQVPIDGGNDRVI
jgi:rhamnose utilization protein RhaD (predicted bifunctional aldolase and dehydrogenase)/NAD(P)-dependent dehydrogenase (short-subunit alcohol dehydrogenase family)